MTALSFDDLESCRQHALQLAQQSKRDIIIYTPDFEPDIYSNDEFLDAAAKFIRSSKQTRIQVLVNDTRKLLEDGHKLLRLYQYTNEQFLLRKLMQDPASQQVAYFISDDRSLLRRPDAGSFRGICYPDDRARVRQQREIFEQQWQVAVAEKNLQTLTL